MRWLLLLLVVGCAPAQLTEDQIFVLLDKYGPRCRAMGVNIEKDPEGTGRCVRALMLSEQRQPSFQENLSYGLRGAGEIMGSTPAIRQRDFRCYADCSSRYSPAYCESLCSY